MSFHAHILYIILLTRNFFRTVPKFHTIIVVVSHFRKMSLCIEEVIPQQMNLMALREVKGFQF